MWRACTLAETCYILAQTHSDLCASYGTTLPVTVNLLFIKVLSSSRPKPKKKVSSAMQSAGIFLAQSNMRSKIIEITTNKLLPYYIIATGGAMLRTSRARFLHR